MKNNNVIISKFNIKDIDKIMLLEETNDNIILSEKSILEDLESNGIYFVAKSNDEIIGYLGSKLLYDHIDILSVLVDSKYTRIGIASKLINHLIEYSKSIQIHEIFLEVRITNIPAQKLYEKLNFTKIDIRKNYYTDTLEDALIYKKI